MTTKPGRFAGLVDGRKTPATSEPIEETPQPVEGTKRPPETVKVARIPAKVAKYKDPDRKNFGFLIKVETNATASFLLKKMRNGEDMSDLIERLLSEWIEQNKD